MRTELISIPTPAHPPDAAYYTPDGPSKSAVMYCHGNQINFYVCAARFAAKYLAEEGPKNPARPINDLNDWNL